jgi:hypothetical protein
MFAALNRRTLTAWIATLILLFSAMAPAIAQAVNGGARSAIWSDLSDICRADNSAAATHDGKDQHQTHAAAHCPFCATHASIALLPPQSIVLPIIIGHDHFPSLFYQSPSPLFSWAASQPRGPPALS